MEQSLSITRNSSRAKSWWNKQLGNRGTQKITETATGKHLCIYFIRKFYHESLINSDKIYSNELKMLKLKQIYLMLNMSTQSKTISSSGIGTLSNLPEMK